MTYALTRIPLQTSKINNFTGLWHGNVYYRTTDHLGSGQFGTVKRGVWQSPNGPVDVAVKMLKSSSGQDDKVKFLQEAAIMGQFLHPNTVKLFGVVISGEPVRPDCWIIFTIFSLLLLCIQKMMVLELLAKGDLQQHLISTRPEWVSVLYGRNISCPVSHVCTGWVGLESRSGGKGVRAF